MTLFVRFKHDSLEIIQLKPKISWANTGKELPSITIPSIKIILIDNDSGKFKI